MNIKAIIFPLTAASRRLKQSFLSLLDFFVFPLLLWGCYVIRLFDLSVDAVPNLMLGEWLVSLVAVFSLFLTGVYRFIVRSFNEMMIGRLAMATILTVIVLYLLARTTSAFIPNSIPLMFGFTMFAWVWFSRSVIRFFIRILFLQTHKLRKRMVIYGAGAAGQQVAGILIRSEDHLPLYFIDDNPALNGRILGGLKVYSAEQAKQRFARYQIDEVLIALPSVSRERKQAIVKFLEDSSIKITELPGLTRLVDGNIRISDIQDVDIVDLLGRNPVAPIPKLLSKNIKNKVVMVTGAGGSIGSELCRQIIKNQPRLLILYELTEFALYAIEKELQQSAQCNLIPILGTVLEQAKLERIIEQYQVQTVYHAAAYKHVPLVEANPIAGLKNNAVGTAFSVNASVNKGVETFVLISTDKAVRPTNVMGASKRMAELYCQAMAEKQHQTQISMVRFGNVLGSSGSVVPLFKQQIAKGGPITVTHPDVTRYFMTIPEASQLVIQAGALGTGGDVFLLDMGEPVRIQDLARQMIKLSGLTFKEQANQEGDIEIQYSGLRAGEKLYEELLIDKENAQKTLHDSIFLAREKFFPYDEIVTVIERMAVLEESENDLEWVLEQLEYYVDGYKRSQDVRNYSA